MSASTWRDYDAVLRMHLLPVFGPMRVDQVEPRHFSAWKEAALDRGMSPRSIVRCLITAGQVFTHASGTTASPRTRRAGGSCPGRR